MRISGCSSDVCSSDLEYIERCGRLRHRETRKRFDLEEIAADDPLDSAAVVRRNQEFLLDAVMPVGQADIGRNGRRTEVAVDCIVDEIGRASCRERVCEYV